MGQFLPRGDGFFKAGLIVALALLPATTRAQEAAGASGQDSEAAQASPTEPAEKPQKNLKFSIIGGPFYNSKVKFAVGAAPLLTFSLAPERPELQRSTVTFPFSISSNKSFSLAAAGRIFWPGDRMRGAGILVLKDGPDRYWGRGYENGANPDNEESYQAREIRLSWTQSWETVDSLYLGAGVDIGYQRATEYAEGGNIASDPTSPETFNPGLVGLVSYDSRDVVANAYSGMLLELETKVYRRWYGGDYDFERYRLDYRGYHKISATRNFAIAWQLLTERAAGEVPWQELPALGSPKEMRAYFLDRYRDTWRVLGQFELRLHELYRRHGLVTWVAAGTVAPSLSKASIRETLIEVGLGYRFRLQPRQNARIDFAVGRGSIAFALNVLEAF